MDIWKRSLSPLCWVRTVKEVFQIQGFIQHSKENFYIGKYYRTLCVCLSVPLLNYGHQYCSCDNVSNQSICPPLAHSQLNGYVKNIVDQPQLMLLVIGELVEFSPFKSVMTTDNSNLVLYEED